MKACCNGCSSCPCVNPSTVSIRRPSAWAASSTQVGVSLPSSSTAQAPHSPVSQPCFTLHSPARRRAAMSESPGAQSSSRFTPFSSKATFITRSTLFEPWKPARHRAAIFFIRCAEGTPQRRLFVQPDESIKRQEHQPTVGQQPELLKPEAFAQQDQEDGKIHRVAAEAIQAAEDELDR